MGLGTFFFKLVGNRLKIEDKERSTAITWKRLSSFELILVFLVVMMAIWGVANYLEKEELWGSPMPKLNTQALIIYWSIWIIILLHILFNRKSILQINSSEFKFKKRRWLARKHHNASTNLIAFILKEQNNFYETDAIPRREIFNVYVRFSNGKRIKLDSFNKEDADRIKSALEEFTSDLSNN